NGLPARVYHRVSSASPAARGLIDSVRDYAAGAAHEQLAAMVAVLGAAGHRVRAAAVAISAVTVPDDLEAVLASHTLWHEAEMQLYRDALVDAADEAGLKVVRYRDKTVFGDVARQGGETETLVRQRIDALRADVGAPWTKV